MSVSRRRLYCSVFGCLENSYRTPELSFFNIPREPEKRLQWLRLISREDLIEKSTIYRRVCEKHFNEQDILKVDNAVRRRLKKNSFPCLNLHNKHTAADKFTQTELTMDTSSRETHQFGSFTLEDITIDESSNQDQFMSENVTETGAPLSPGTTQKRKLESKLKSGQKRLKLELIEKKNRRDMFHELCDRFLSNDLAVLVKAQTYLKSYRKGNKYSLEYKMFCLNLYTVSPQACRLLEKTLCLPSKVALNKLYIPMSTQVDVNLLGALKFKVNNMTDGEKHCTLVVKAMRLKTNLYYDIKNDKIIGFHEVDGMQSPVPAKYALVVLLQGIFEKWSQPIGFALTTDCKNDDNISKWIDRLVIKLFEIGLKVRAFVSDLVSDFLNAAKKRGISTDKTHFFINGHKIYYIFDAPHLIQSVRNNFLTYDFHFGNEAVAKFEHIIKFFEHDQKKTFKQAYKLNNNHVNPSNDTKMKVRYATQLLSRSVAAGISSCIDAKVIDESANHTVELIKNMNDLFDALNSSVIRHSYTYKRAFHGDENQVLFFNNMLLFFQTLKLINSKTGLDDTNGVDFIEGFQITIKSILRLHENLKQEGYQYLLTRRLNQDSTENLFQRIRSENCKATVPTSRQFISAFRKQYFANLLQPMKEGNGTEVEDLSKFLEHLKDLETRLNNNNQYNEQENSLREIVRSDYIEMEIPEKNAFIYVCAVLMRQCLMQHKYCESFKSFRNVYEKVNSETDRNLLVVPPDDFVKTIEKLGQVFRDAFQKQYLNCKIGLSIYKEMKEIDFKLPCPCFPKEYLLKLYIRMRIYFTLKSNSQAFRTSRNCRKYFRIDCL